MTRAPLHAAPPADHPPSPAERKPTGAAPTSPLRLVLVLGTSAAASTPTPRLLGPPPTMMPHGIEEEFDRIQEVVAGAVRGGENRPTLLQARSVLGVDRGGA